MGAIFKFYKRKFRNALEPVFVMLIDKKRQMQADEWSELIAHVTTRILKNPEEFLGADLPGHDLMCDILYEIFEQFIKEKGREDKQAFHRIGSILIQSKHIQSKN